MFGVLPAAIPQLSNQPGAISQASDQMETINGGKKRHKFLAGTLGRRIITPSQGDSI